MANTGKTTYGGTVVEVRAKGGGDDDWKKFVCNENAIEIDYGTREINSCIPLESEIEEVMLGPIKFGENQFTYAWTQELTNEADTIIKEAQKNKTIIEVRLTMDNATGDETIGTTYVTPFYVLQYKHKGEVNSIWKTDTNWRQTALPVETAAA